MKTKDDVDCLDTREEAGSGGFASMRWPDVPRLAFGPGTDPMLNARFDWIRNERDQGLAYYLNAYTEAIRVLYRSAVERRMVVEHTVLPMAFLWRHRIELLLKSVINTARELHCEEKTAELKHDLVDLWRKAKAYIMPLGPSDAPEIVNAEVTIMEFQRIDPWADGFRYPLSRDGKMNLSGVPDSVDIVALNDAMEALANFLSGVSAELGSRLDFFIEQEAEMRACGASIDDEQRAEMRRNYMSRH